jgi:hypothetical protein
VAPGIAPLQQLRGIQQLAVQAVVASVVEQNAQLMLFLPTAACFSIAVAGSLERQLPLQRHRRLWRQLLLLLLLWLLLSLLLPFLLRLRLLSWRQPVAMELHHALPVLVNQEVSLRQLNVVHAHKELAEAALRPTLEAQGRWRALLPAAGGARLLLLRLLLQLLLRVRCGNEAGITPRGPLGGQARAEVCPGLNLEGRQRLENVVCMAGRRQAVASGQHDLGMRSPGLVFEGRVQAGGVVPGGVGHVCKRAATEREGGGHSQCCRWRCWPTAGLLVLPSHSALLAVHRQRPAASRRQRDLSVRPPQDGHSAL